MATATTLALGGLAGASGASRAAQAQSSPAAPVADTILWGPPPERQNTPPAAPSTHLSDATATASSRFGSGRLLRDTNTTSFDVAGVKVILRRVTANDVVAANIFLLGGTRQLTPQTAGLEALLLEASERGTRHYSRDALRRTMARLGSEIVVDPDPDWTLFGLRCVRSEFDSTWTVLADRLMYPSLDSAGVSIIKDQFETALRQRQDSPDALVQYLADSATFAGHPYSIPPVGTDQSIAAITIRQLRGYHDSQIVRSRLLVVVVGNVERTQLERLIQRTLARLPQGDYRWTPPPEPAPRPSTLTVQQRTLPTNYILGYYQGPQSYSSDYQPLRVASAVLSGRLFTEIRSRRNLTYAVNAPFVDRAVTAGGLYVTTVSPDTTLMLMRREIDNLQHGQIVPEALERLVQQFITEYFLDNETNDAQATFLARAQLYRGDYRAAERFVDELRAVTPADVQRVARRYMRNVKFAYVGDTLKLSRTIIARFGDGATRAGGTP